MKPANVFGIIVTATFLFVSCNNAKDDNKPEPTDIESPAINNNTTGDTTQLTKPDTSTTATEPAPVTPTPVTAEKKKKPAPRSLTRGFNDPEDIIANIDSYVVTNAKFTAVSGGGFTDCIVTVTNTLDDATFQKALVEVKIKKQDGAAIKTDYYTVVNIEPGMTKNIKIPNNNQGVSVHSSVIKIKSAELTNGEFVLAGNL